MAELIDNNPVFTIVMDCYGCGKSAWKCGNYVVLPLRYIDEESVAGDFADWIEQDYRYRRRVLVDQKIDEYLE